MVQASTAALTVFSFGGGVQSTAALVLAAQGKLDCKTFLFCNVGDDSENPGTLRYVREISMPYAKRHGIELIELQRRFQRGPRKGEVETLYGRVMRPGSRSIDIPARVYGRPMPRKCTSDFKIKVISGWCWKHGARPTNPATTMLGISTDERLRMRNASGISYTRLAYPLVERGMSRADCLSVIARAGLPLVPKSSCWFCSFHTVSQWRDLRDHHPDLFAKACGMEPSLTGRGTMRKPVYLTRFQMPLAQAVQGVQPSLFEDDDVCESGYCMV